MGYRINIIKRARGRAGLALLPALLFAGCNPFIYGYVPSESGFDGAVAVESEEQNGDIGIVTATVPYIGVYGDAQEGLARLVLYRDPVESGQPIPAFCHVHYEQDIGASIDWAKRGWAVFSALYDDGDYPIDVSVANGHNLARAIIQWARRLPFIDRTHLHIDGGSQGGYMALAMSAECFPVTATTATAPVVNWAYNLAYFEGNKAVWGYPDNPQDSAMPIMAGVTGITDWAYGYFGNDLSADAWYRLSPIAYLDRIANPVLVTAATGDMLVPMAEMTRDHLRPVDRSQFPEGYVRDFDTLTQCEAARRVFEECLDEDTYAIHIEALQEHSFLLTAEMLSNPGRMPRKKPDVLDSPWSPDRQWSLLYLDEGGPSPEAGHTTYYWNTSPLSFTTHYQQAEPAPEILTLPKLERLMQRFTLDLQDLPLLSNGNPVNRLNYPGLERHDVAVGLLDYVGISEAHALRLQGLYAACSLKPFGDELTLEDLQDLKQYRVAQKGR